jgi:hypothetical protein
LNTCTDLDSGKVNSRYVQGYAHSLAEPAEQSVILPSGPVGTIYMAYLLDSSGNLVAVTPWSSALINVGTSVAEPSSLALLGMGLLAMGLLIGRRGLGGRVSDNNYGTGLKA